MFYESVKLYSYVGLIAVFARRVSCNIKGPFSPMAGRKGGVWGGGCWHAHALYIEVGIQ